MGPARSLAIFPSERLRKQLEEAGIPRSDHSYFALRRFLPKELVTANMGPMDIDIMTEVLIYLINKKVILPPLRETQSAREFSRANS